MRRFTKPESDSRFAQVFDTPCINRKKQSFHVPVNLKNQCTVLPRNNLSKTASGPQAICVRFASAGARGCVQLASFPRLLCVCFASVLRLRAPADAGGCVHCVFFCVPSSGKRIRSRKLHEHLLYNAKTRRCSPQKR